MPTLWRLLALAWLGGMASPALADDPATIGEMNADGTSASISASAEEETGEVGIAGAKPVTSEGTKTAG